MATKKVTLDPSESREVAFSFTPSVAKVYAVNIDGLNGSFKAIAIAPATLYGTVVDVDTGYALLNVFVEVIETDLSTTTSTDGSYEITDIPPRTYTIQFTRSGYETLTKIVTLVAGANPLSASLTPYIPPPTEAEIKLSSWLEPKPAWKGYYDVGQSFEIWVGITNIGSVACSYEGRFTKYGMFIKGFSGSLEPGESNQHSCGQVCERKGGPQYRQIFVDYNGNRDSILSPSWYGR